MGCLGLVTRSGNDQHNARYNTIPTKQLTHTFIPWLDRPAMKGGIGSILFTLSSG